MAKVNKKSIPPKNTIVEVGEKHPYSFYMTQFKNPRPSERIYGIDRRFRDADEARDVLENR